MDSGTLALYLVAALWALFALWVWVSSKSLEHVRGIQRILMGADKAKTDYLNQLEQRTAGVEALLVSTVGQETECFCKAMDEIMAKMEGPDAKQEPAPKPEEKLTLSEQYCGAFKPPKPDKWRGGKKGAGRG